MKKFLPIILILVTLPLHLLSKEKYSFKSSDFLNFKVSQQALKNFSEYPSLQSLSEVLPFNVNKSFMNKIFTSLPDEIAISDFPITATTNSNITLQRETHNPFIHTRLLAYRANGVKQVLKSPDFIMYSGKIDGEPNSMVSLVCVGSNIFGYIKQDDGTLTSISPFTGGSENLHYLTPHIMNPSAADSERETYSCLTQDYTGLRNEALDIMKYGKDKLLAKPELLQANILCEGAYDFYTLLGKDDERAINYIYSVMAMTAKIYLEFLNVDLNVSDVVLRTSADSDPYQNTVDLTEKLWTMPDVWSSSPKKRALVVLFANLGNQPKNTVVAGISMGGDPYVGSICNKFSGYCVLGINGYYAYPTNRYTWDVNVAAHEIGHNFSAPHTHNCYFAPNMIDTCVTGLTFAWGDACIDDMNPIPRPGTIMSYCHVTNSTHSVDLIFHQREIPLMRTAAEDCDCITAKTDKFLSLTYPLGDTIYRIGNGNKINVHWSSVGIDKVDIYFRKDSDTVHDILLISDYDATLGEYSFDTPNYPISKAYIVIEESDNPDNFDSSIDPFSVDAQKIEFIVPKAGDGFANGETITATWKDTFNDFLKLELTTDGGSHWKTLVGRTQEKYYLIDSLSGELPNCQLRLTSEEDHSVVKSPVFSIGTANLKITFPNGGEEVSANETQFIKWESKNVHECFIDYSTNNGQSWRLVQLAKLDASGQQYQWNVPKINCDSALVRIRSVIDNTVLDQSDNMFKISYIPTSVDETNKVLNGTIAIKSIAPNPFNDNTTVLIDNTTDKFQEAELIISDEIGKVQFSLGKFIVDANSQLVKNVSVKNLPIGNYYITLKIDDKNISSHLVKIVR